MPTQVLLDDGERYRLKDGKQLGCLAERKWMTKIPLMKPATQAEIAAMLQRE